MSLGLPCSAAQMPISSASSVISIVGNGRRSPCITACETQRDFFRSFSRFAGLRFLPPEVMMISFLRPVIDEKAVSVEPAEIACVQPALDERPGGGTRVSVVALEYVGAPDEDLAVAGDPDLDSGQRPANRSELEVRPVGDGDCRGGLGHPVALCHRDPGRVEELEDLFVDRRGAGPSFPQAAAEDRSYRGEYLLVDRSHGKLASGGSSWPGSQIANPNSKRDDLRDPPRRAVPAPPGDHRVDLLEDARDRREVGRADLAHLLHDPRRSPPKYTSVAPRSKEISCRRSEKVWASGRNR